MQMLMSGLGALIMTGICGLSGFFIIADERRGHGAEAAVVTAAAPAGRDISTREVDPEPLTVDEVFAQRDLAIVPGASPYVVRMRHIDTDCNIATSGSLGDLLQKQGCTQVVRATMVAPIEGYPVTAGILNLADEAGAAAAAGQIKSIVDGDRGSFAGMVVGPGTEPVGKPTAQVSWHTRGHYLVYCVVARPDGEIVRDDDPYARRIVFDLIESYLRDGVIGRRGLATS
jgi:hypothetical protein